MSHHKYAQLQLVTSQAVHRTVLCDDEVYLWSRKLCSLPEVIRKLNSSIKDAPGHYRDCRIFSCLAYSMGLVFGGVCLMFVLSPGMRSFVFYLLGTGAAAGVVFFFLKRREHVAALTVSLIEMDMPEFPLGVTLYQIGEIYSRKYQMPSLVDIIWLRERWIRNAFVYLYLGSLGVYFFSFQEILFWTAVGCALVLCLFHMLIMLRRGV